MGAIAKEAVFLKEMRRRKIFCIIVNFCIKMTMGREKICTIVVNFFKDENEMTNSTQYWWDVQDLLGEAVCSICL